MCVVLIIRDGRFSGAFSAFFHSTNVIGPIILEDVADLFLGFPTDAPGRHDSHVWKPSSEIQFHRDGLFAQRSDFGQQFPLTENRSCSYDKWSSNV